MSSGRSLRFGPLVLAAAVLLFAGDAVAQGPATNRNSAGAALTITATVVPALYLQISSASGGAAVTGTTGPASTGASALDFGNVNGLGMGSPAAGVSVVTTDQSGALYTTALTLTPYFSGFSSSTTATITVVLDPSNSLGSTAELYEGSSGATASTVSTTTPDIITSTATSSTPIRRYLGLFIKNSAHQSPVNETLSARLVYEITVP
jgi:hypothetical protein